MVMHLVLDESGQQVVQRPLCVGIASCAEIDALEERLGEIHAKWSSEERFEGLGSFDAFMKEGFHNNQIPPELQVRFIDELESMPFFRLSISFTRRERFPDLDDDKMTMIMYADLLADLIRQRGSTEYKILLENNQYIEPRLGRLVEKVVERALADARRDWSPPRIDYEIVSKTDLHAVGVIDFALKVIGDWLMEADRQDVTSFKTRNYRALRRRISVISDFDTGKRLSRRALNL